MNRRVRVALLLTVLVAAVSGCGGRDPKGSQGERAVTAEEASRMAEALFNNYDLGGADFEVNAQMPDGTRVVMTGAVDWRTHAGHAQVQISQTADAAVTEVYWTDAVVFERVPSLTALAERLGEPRADFYVRPPDVVNRHLDAMIQLLTSLGSEQRDNAVLISQQPGTAWMRSDTIPTTNEPVDVLRYGQHTIYWLAADGVTLLRFEGNNSAGTRPVLIDLRDHGPRTIEFPQREDAIETALVAELYAAATGG